MRSDLVDKIEVVLPADFPIIMMRTAFVAKDTPRRRAAIAFLRYLTSLRWSDPEEGDYPRAVLFGFSVSVKSAMVNRCSGI